MGNERRGPAYSLRAFVTHPVVRTAYCILVLIFLAVVVRRVDWDKLDPARLNHGWLAASILFLALHSLVYAYCWHLFTASAGIKMGRNETFSAWFQSLVGKYIPAKLGMVAQRIVYYEHRLPGKGVLVGKIMLVEWFFNAGGGAVVAIVTAGMGYGVFPYYVFAGGLAACAVVAAGCAVLWRSAIFRRTFLEIFHSKRRAFVILALYVPAWILNGFSMYSSVRAVGAETVPLPQCVSLFALGAVAGMVSLFAPAGLGVRDGILFAGLAGPLGVANAVAAAALSRLAFIINDLSLAFGAFAYHLAVRRRNVSKSVRGRGESGYADGGE